MTSYDYKKAYQIGENGDGTVLTDVYDPETDTFDVALMSELCGVLIGKEGGASVADVRAYIDANCEIEFGSKIVKAPTLNQNADAPDGGILIQIYAAPMMVTSLTIDYNDNVIVTLWSVNEKLGHRKFLSNINRSNESSYPSNMYSSSQVRYDLVSVDGSANWHEFAYGHFATEYLVQPKDIAYQHTESLAAKDPEYGYMFVNEALDNMGDENFAEGYNYFGKTGDPANEEFSEAYNAWGEDYLWVPSLTEVGDKEFVADSIWELTTVQRNSGCWLRSGTRNTYGTALSLDETGKRAAVYVNSSLTAPPAVHLNLSKAAKDAKGHEHTYEDKWSVDETNHWHAATCQHTSEKGELGEHEWDEGTVTTEPKCEESGLKSFTCTVCGKTKTEVLPPTDHKPEIIPAVDATCTSSGATAGSKCSACDKILTEPNEIPAKGHKYQSAWTTDDFNHWHVCDNECGIKGENKAHVFEWKIDEAADFTTTGLMHEECTTCGFTRNEDTTIPVQTCGHNNAVHHDRVAATCIGSGTVEYNYCPDCGKNLNMAGAEITDLVIPADSDNHMSFGEWQTETAATCVDKGSEKRVCADCGHDETRDIEIDPDNHDLVNHEAQAATCTQNGWNEYDTCTRCGYTTYSEISATGHTSVTDEAVAPTCTETGLTAGAHCSVCNAVLTAQEEVPARGHSFSTEWSDDETNHWHVCTVCGEKSEEAAHSYEWEITTPPTEEAEGEKKEKCTVCGHFGATETIAKLIKDPNGNGDVVDLPPDKDYDLDIEVTETGSLYHLKGINKGYAVNLYVVDGEQKTPYDNSKTVTLSLAIPEGMSAENFTLYKLEGGKYEKITDYKISGRIITVRTTLSAEFVFNAPAPAAGIPWWVWLIVGLGGAVIIGVVAVIIVVVKKKNAAAVVSAADNSEVLKILGEHGEKIDELIEISDGGFNDKIDE